MAEQKKKVKAAALKDSEDAFFEEESEPTAAHDLLDDEDSDLSADSLTQKIIREAKVPAAMTVVNLATHATADGVRLAAAKYILEFDRTKNSDDDYWDDALKRLSNPPKKEKPKPESK